jgi:hypothetical protein
MQTTMRDVPVKARRKIPYQDKYEEYPTRAWVKLSKQIGLHIKKGGDVVLSHRRLEAPIPGRYGNAFHAAYSRPAPYDIVEVCDVEFQ